MFYRWNSQLIASKFSFNSVLAAFLVLVKVLRSKLGLAIFLVLISINMSSSVLSRVLAFFAQHFRLVELKLAQFFPKWEK